MRRALLPPAVLAGAVTGALALPACALAAPPPTPSPKIGVGVCIEIEIGVNASADGCAPPPEPSPRRNPGRSPHRPNGTRSTAPPRTPRSGATR